MILVDKEIERLLRKRKGISIKPQIDRDLQIQPSSLDLRLGNTFSKIKSHTGDIHLHHAIEYEEYEIEDGESFNIPANSFTLAETLEYINLPDNISAFVEGRSSVGRAGLQVENAGWVDNGFEGTITLELKNLTNKNIIIKPGIRICQLVFSRTELPLNSYDGKYMRQKGATGSRMYKDSELNNKEG